jgi:hypothetical protein
VRLADFLGRIKTQCYFISSASFRSRIRLLSLSTGEEHRLARDNATLEHLPAVPRVRWMHSIRISGDYLGILFINNDDDGDDDDDDDGNELVVWNWKTGVKNLVSEHLHLLLRLAI